MPRLIQPSHRRSLSMGRLEGLLSPIPFNKEWGGHLFPHVLTVERGTLYEIITFLKIHPLLPPISRQGLIYILPFRPSRAAEVPEKKAKMERHLPLGYHFKPTDEDIIVCLFCRVNGLPSPTEFVLEGNLRNFRIDQPPDIERDGCLGKLYWYIDCSYKRVSGRITRDRDPEGGKGNWKSTDGKKPVYAQQPDNHIVGHKQRFSFHQPEHGKKVPTTWVMTEYTINESNTNAICVLHNTKKD